MTHAEAHGDVNRIEEGGFQYPLGVRPLDLLQPKQGFAITFETADGGDEPGGWEEWPDRYVFEVFVSADRLASLTRALFALLPGRVYPILDMLGEDAHREIDPYIAYELVGLDHFLAEFERRRDWLLEDGLVGFGAMSAEPFLYIYMDEHKIVTVRAAVELKPAIEQTLRAFDLDELDEIAAIDSVAHEHLSVLPDPADATEPVLSAYEAQLEELLDAWRLVLNVDDLSNVDEDGTPLGVTPWRLTLRLRNQQSPESSDYFEVLALASSRIEAMETALDALRILRAEEEDTSDGGDDAAGDGSARDDPARAVANDTGAFNITEALLISADRLPTEALNGDLPTGDVAAMSPCALQIAPLQRAS